MTSSTIVVHALNVTVGRSEGIFVGRFEGISDVGKGEAKGDAEGIEVGWLDVGVEEGVLGVQKILIV